MPCVPSFGCMPNARVLPLVGAMLVAASTVSALTAVSAPAAAAATPLSTGDFATVMGYRPIAENGIRVKPTGSCSSPVPLPTEFTDPCRAHDLGYDELRYAARIGTPFRRPFAATSTTRSTPACTRPAQPGPNPCRGCGATPWRPSPQTWCAPTRSARASGAHEQSRRNIARRRRRVAARHAQAGHWAARSRPMLNSGTVRYEVGANIDATGFGGIAAVHRLVTRLGLVEEIDERSAAVEGAPALSRVRPRAEPGLQRAVRRHPARGHRTAAPRHRLHERPWCGPDPGPDHGRGLLPPVRRGRRGDVDGGDQRGAPAAVGRARAASCSARSPTSTPTAPSRPPAGSTRPGWTSPTRASGATRR